MPATAWVNFVKAYHKKHGGTYKSAMKGASAEWKKKGKSKAAEPEMAAPKRRRRKKKKL